VRLNVACENCAKPLFRYKTKSSRHYCNINCKSEWQREQKPVDKEWLYQKYVVEKLSANDIAKIVNRNSKRVWEWIRDYGIETRPRGNNFDKDAYWATGKPNPFEGKKHSVETRVLLRGISLKDGRVPYLNKFGIHHMKDKIGEKSPNWNGGSTPQRQAMYCTEIWKEAVKAVWKRDDAICQSCRLDSRTVKRKQTKFHIHHLYPFVHYKHLTTVPSNLILLCAKCHRFVHSKKNIDKKFMLKEMTLPKWLISKSIAK
jgi:hypothetical protein